MSRLGNRTAVVAATVAVIGALTTQPAFASNSVSYHGTRVQVDNNPGNGAAGWVWVYGSTEYGSTGGSIEYTLTNGTTDDLRVGMGKSASRSTSADIRSFRACAYKYIDGYDVVSCSDWYYLS